MTITLHQRTTEWRNTGELRGEKMRVTYGFDVAFARNYKQAPYFSITCDIRDNHGDAGGGAAHEKIAKVFPELARFIPWHLTSWDKGPMHYEANAMYWFRKIGLPKEKSYDPDPEEAFKSTIVFGALPSDERTWEAMRGALLERQVPRADLDKGIFDGKQEALFAAPRKPIEQECAAWLKSRLPLLLQAFVATMEAAGLAEKTDDATETNT
jgi:hypothetical protein